MITKRTAAPAVPAVTLANIKAHLRIEPDDTYGDVRLEPYLYAAIDQTESLTGRALITQTWDLIFDSWAEVGRVVFPFGNFQSVVSLKYFDADGAEQTVDEAEYDVVGIGTDDGRVIYYDSPALRDFDPVTIQIVCGFGDADTDVPETVQSAIKLMVEEMETGVDVQPTVERLLNANRLYSW